jgi:hypothetical protein
VSKRQLKPPPPPQTNVDTTGLDQIVVSQLEGDSLGTDRALPPEADITSVMMLTLTRPLKQVPGLRVGCLTLGLRVRWPTLGLRVTAFKPRSEGDP